MRSAWIVPVVTLTGLAIAGCATTSQPGPEAAPAAAPVLPAKIQPSELVGRWGLASYHRPDDRVRTEAQARNQCSKPYVIGMGTSGGVIMHLADEREPQELRLKGSPSGKDYIGPAGEAGLPQDREVIEFNGRVLVTRFVDPEVHGRYGNYVFVRCAPRA
jgi:hypothetical protein